MSFVRIYVVYFEKKRSSLTKLVYILYIQLEIIVLSQSLGCSQRGFFGVKHPSPLFWKNYLTLLSFLRKMSENVYLSLMELATKMKIIKLLFFHFNKKMKSRIFQHKIISPTKLVCSLLTFFFILTETEASL